MIDTMIDVLPPLPTTVVKLQEFKESHDREPKELVAILEHDPLIVSTLLKICNSAMFSIRGSVDSVQRAVSLLGVDFSLSIAFGSIVKNSLPLNMDAYGIDEDTFLFSSFMASKFLKSWNQKASLHVNNKLYLAAFLQESGKFIISDFIAKEDKLNYFQRSLKNHLITCEAEKEVLGFGSSFVTAKLFKHWNIDTYIIDVIEQVDDILNEDFVANEESVILYILKNLFDPCEIYKEEKILKMLEIAQKYDFDKEILAEIIIKGREEIEK